MTDNLYWALWLSRDTLLYMGEELSGITRGIIGCFGGLAAVISKYLGQDHAYYLRLLDLGNQQIKIDNLWLGYKIMSPSLVFLGALLAWASYENHRVKLLAIAVAAPALITTWAGGATSANKFAFNFVAPAYAADASIDVGEKVSVTNGLKLFFGIGKDEERYHVVAGSYKNKTDAALVAEKIIKREPSLNAFIGERRPNNEYYPVIVGDYTSYSEAAKLKDKVKDLSLTPEPYLTPYRFQ